MFDADRDLMILAAAASFGFFTSALMSDKLILQL